MKIDWREYIISTPEVLGGKPRIKDMRIPVGLILGYLADDYTTDQILEEFPDLRKEHILACLNYARDLASFREIAV